MNICLLTIDLSTVGGINKVTFDLARDFMSLGYKVNVCGIINGEKDCFYKVDGINISSLFNEELPMKEYLFSGAKKLVTLLQEEDVDVCLLQGEAAGLLGAYTRFKYKKCKYIYCDHGALTYDISGLRKFITDITLWVCGHMTDMSIFETLQGKNDFKKLVGGRVSKYEYIYNYGNDKVKLCEENNNYRLVTVGRMTSQKGFDYAVEVAKRITSDKPWVWDFIGDGEDRLKIEELIKEYHLENRINLLGSVKDLENKYKDYYLMIGTSRHEGLPMALIDAKFAKLPIISFDIKTGPSEIIVDGVNGNLIEAFDIDKMARTISDIINDSSKRNAYVENAWVNKEKFDKKQVLLKWKKVLEGLK